MDCNAFCVEQHSARCHMTVSKHNNAASSTSSTDFSDRFGVARRWQEAAECSCSLLDLGCKRAYVCFHWCQQGDKPGNMMCWSAQ